MTIAPAPAATAESAGWKGPEKEDHRMEASHVSALQLKHAGLERRIQEEMSRPLPDDGVIQELKRRKLRIKEELSQH
jgi:hypothetical protein